MAILTPQQTMGLALEHYRARHYAEAEMLCRQLLARDPQNADVIQMLGLVAYETRRFPEALDWLRRAIAVRPREGRFYSNLGLLLADWNRLDESAEALETARQLEPGDADIHFNLGNTRMRQRQWDAAILAFQAARQLQPELFKAWLNLGAALNSAGRREEAIACYQATRQRFGAAASIDFNLGNILRELGRLDESLAAFQSARALAPRDPFLLNNLGMLRHDRGELAEAEEALRQSLAASPRADVHSNLIFVSLFDPAIAPDTIREEQREWNTLYVVPLRGQRRPHANDRSPDRPLRIGYVSADLRNHAVGRTLLPILEARDRSQIECVCYSGPARDAVAERFRARADRWHDTDRWSDEDLAAQVRADGIDILVDLGLHTAHHRLLAFARKPAPVQVSWLGYPGATGVETMDYHLTDRFLQPPEDSATEPGGQPFPLPDAWCCYPAPDDSPEVNSLPALETGRVTFASFNNFAKINESVLALWGRILQSVPDSRLLLLARSGGHQERARATLHGQGIAPERVEFQTYLPAAPQRHAAAYLHRYAGVDIALDPFPYNGMTTTGDALWMGVPVVALRGVTSLSRASFSLLSNAGLPELAASTEDEYVGIATGLAVDLPRLAQMRAVLRGRMLASPLLDPARFARNLEAAYRAMWREWCLKPADA